MHPTLSSGFTDFYALSAVKVPSFIHGGVFGRIITNQNGCCSYFKEQGSLCREVGSIHRWNRKMIFKRVDGWAGSSTRMCDKWEIVQNYACVIQNVYNRCEALTEMEMFVSLDFWLDKMFCLLCMYVLYVAWYIIILSIQYLCKQQETIIFLNALTMLWLVQSLNRY